MNNLLNPYDPHSAEVLLDKIPKMAIGNKENRDKNDTTKGFKMDIYLNGSEDRRKGLTATFENVKTNRFGIQRQLDSKTKRVIEGEYTSQIVVEKGTILHKYLTSFDGWVQKCGEENNKKYAKYCKRLQTDSNKTCLDGEVDYNKWWFSIKTTKKTPVGKELLESSFKKSIKENVGKTGEKYEDTFYIKISGKPKQNWALTKIQKYDEKRKLFSEKNYDPSEFLDDDKLDKTIFFKYLTLRFPLVHATKIGIGLTAYAKFIGFVEGENYNQHNLLPVNFGVNPSKDTYKDNDVEIKEKKLPPPPPQSSTFNTGYDYAPPTPQPPRPPLKDQAKIGIDAYKQNKMDEKRGKVVDTRKEKLEEKRKENLI